MDFIYIKLYLCNNFIQLGFITKLLSLSGGCQMQMYKLELKNSSHTQEIRF